MQFTTEIADNAKFKILLLDANILIPFLDQKYADQEHRDEIVDELARLVSLGIDLIYPQPCYLEILNYFRGKWIYVACERLVRYQPRLVPFQVSGILKSAEQRRLTSDHDRYLYDSEIKTIRNLTYSKGNLWKGISSAVSGQILKLEKELTKSKIHYAKFDSIYYPLADKSNRLNGMECIN